jgi:hypothetical protein
MVTSVQRHEQASGGLLPALSGEAASVLDTALKVLGIACGLAVGALIGAGGPTWLDAALVVAGSIVLAVALQVASRRPQPPKPDEAPRGQTRVIVMGGAARPR